MQWEQSCHHQPWCPSSSEAQVGATAAATNPSEDPLLPQLEGCPGLGPHYAPMLEPSSPDFPSSLGPEAGYFSLWGSIRPNDQDRI